MNPYPTNTSENESEEKEKETSVASTTFALFPPNSLAFFPKDVLLTIFSFLDLKSLARLASVSHNFQRISEDNQLWKEFLQSFGIVPNSKDGRKYKEIVKSYIIYFQQLRKNYIENYKNYLLTPPPPNIKKRWFFSSLSKKEELWEKLENLVITSDRNALENFLAENKEKEILFEKKVRDFINLFALAFHTDKAIFKILATFFINNKFFSTKLLVTVEQSRWVLFQCLEQNIEMSIEGNHPIFYAMEYSYDHLINFLIAFNPLCLTETNQEGRTPVEFAFARCKKEIPWKAKDQYLNAEALKLALLLLEATYFFNKKILTSYVTSRFLDCSKNLNVEQFKKNIKFLDIENFKINQFTSVLDYYFCDQYDLTKFAILVKECSNVINNTDVKNDALHKVIKVINVPPLPFCKLLLENGADPNSFDEAGDAVLHKLVNIHWHRDMYELEELLSLLINHHRADLTSANKAGKTPIQIALENRNTVVLKILITQYSASKFITKRDIEESYKTIDEKDQTLISEKESLLWTLYRQKTEEKKQLECNIAAVGGITKPKENNLQLDEPEPDTSFMGITKR